jgi:predicted dinucleotide-binding enzyme
LLLFGSGIVSQTLGQKLVELGHDVVVGKSDQGILAWDVHHLIELTQGIEPQLIPIASIQEIDEA